MAHTKRDEEDLTDRFCVPLSSLTTPIEVGEIGFDPPPLNSPI
jgi:hypothetical protein